MRGRDHDRAGARPAGARVAQAGFSASGCGATTACGSALVDLLTDAPILEAAKVGPTTISEALGALSPGKFHAAELASDALHRALGAAVRAGAALPAARDRTLVAMSGGVDSAVAALIEAERGDAVGVTLELWTDPEGDAERSCCSASAVRSARALAHRLGLPHVTLDLRAEFRAGVVEPWVPGYAAGETPNPCVRCNGHVRLDAMLDLADRLGAAHLATGHYARTAETDDERGPLLRAAADPAKDQSYMLAQLAPGSLARLRFPLGELRKAEVRERAAAAGLPVAGKPDSQDLCFLAGVGRERFLRRRLPDRPGPIVGRDGRALGRHRGQHAFTVGQRKGLGVAAAEPLFVVAKDGDRVIAGTRPSSRRSACRCASSSCAASPRASARSSCATTSTRSEPNSRATPWSSPSRWPARRPASRPACSTATSSSATRPSTRRRPRAPPPRPRPPSRRSAPAPGTARTIRPTPATQARPPDVDREARRRQRRHRARLHVAEARPALHDEREDRGHAPAHPVGRDGLVDRRPAHGADRVGRAGQREQHERRPQRCDEAGGGDRRAPHDHGPDHHPAELAGVRRASPSSGPRPWRRPRPAASSAPVPSAPAW